MYFLLKKILKLKKKNPVLLVSGGIDSYLAWSILDKPKSAFIMLQNKNNGSQIEKLSALVKKHNLDNVVISSNVFSYIPDEDVFFYIYLIYHALVLFPGQYIIFPKTFCLTFNTKLFLYLLKGIDRKNRVLLPFLNYRRDELFTLACSKGENIENILNNTHSCCLEKVDYCGTCSHCIERYYFFKEHGVDFTYDNQTISFDSWLSKTSYKNINLSLKNLINWWKTYFTNSNLV